MINIRIGMKDKLNAVKEMIQHTVTLDYEYDQSNSKLMTSMAEGRNEAEKEIKGHDERLKTHSQFY